MKVYCLKLPVDKGLTNLELVKYARKLGIDNFRGVFMRDTLPNVMHHKECGIVSLNQSDQPGSHWVCYYKDGTHCIYFDSFGQVTPMEIRKYLKTKREFKMGDEVIQRNTDIVQHSNTHVCGHLCLLMLTSLTCEQRSFQQVLDTLDDGYSQGYR